MGNRSWKKDNYWICSEFENTEKSGYVSNNDIYNKIQQACTSVATKSSTSQDNGRTSFLYKSYCTGHRNQNNTRISSEPVYTPLSGDIVYALQINSLRNAISKELNDRRKNGHYIREPENLGEITQPISNNETLSSYVSIGDIVEINYPNKINSVLNTLQNKCNNIFNKKGTKDNTKLSSAIQSLNDINRGSIVEVGQFKNIQNTINAAVSDCICYSDCNGFGCCSCYGYCKCNY